MSILHNSPFPSHIHNLIREMSHVGFFERSLLIGSWVTGEVTGEVLRMLDILAKDL